MRPNITNKLVLCGAIALAAMTGCTNSSSEPNCSLLPGDLVITEVMANPAGQDQGNEWFEIYNASTETIPLRGLLIFASRTDGESSNFHRIIDKDLEIGPGQYLVLGGILPEFAPVYIGYGYADDLGAMRNSDGLISLNCGDTLIDEMTYVEVEDGKSVGLGGPPDYLANDNWDNWCEQSPEFLADNFGTPGLPNSICVAATDCLDGEDYRPIVAPQVGDLLITEFHADSAAVADGDGEWFEVHVQNAVDLNGLVYGKDPEDPKGSITNSECVRATPGDYLLFARSFDPDVNGGLPDVDYVYSFGLTNGGDTLFIGTEDDVIDSIEWTQSVEAGFARALHPDYFDATENDDPLYWCDALFAYGDGDYGTPGTSNPECALAAPQGMCYDEGVLRAIVPPAAGQLVINEYLARPSTDSANREWLELAATASFDLNDVELGRAEPDTGPQQVRQQITQGDCIEVNSGDFIVFARNTDMALNGGLPQADYELGFAVVDSNDGLFISTDDGTNILDVITYTTTRPQGRSVQRDPASPDDTFCNAPDGTEYGTGDERGTPGAVNTCI